MELCISILEFYFILFFYFFGSKEIQGNVFVIRDSIFLSQSIER